MGLNIIVCAKQVPDPEGPPSSFEINEAELKVTARGIPPVINPFDENALEAAMRIKESHEQARPMIHLDPRHKLTQEFVALFETLG